MELLPSQKKYLSLKEASAYYSIGEKRLRMIIDEYRYSEDWVLMNGNKILIDREGFDVWSQNKKYL